VRTGNGRAFVLVRAVPNVRDLRSVLHDKHGLSWSERQDFARSLGRAWHICIAPGSTILISMPSTSFATCQATSFSLSTGSGLVIGSMSVGHSAFAIWPRSNATVAERLATLRERIACLFGLRAGDEWLSQGGFHSEILERIQRLTSRLRVKRRIRHQWQPPLPAGTQNLVWLDGEALCVTEEFRATFQGDAPDG